MITTVKQAFAEHCGLDISEVKEYRYQPSRTNKPVYSINEVYINVTRNNESPAKHRDIDFNWIEVKDTYINSQGFKIWQSL